jgi:hypothetical protein
MQTARLALTAAASLAAISLACVLLLGRESRAVQAPRISIDMAPEGNAYDENTNTMIAGPVDLCLGTAAPGNNAEHTHVVQILIHDVEDLVGWQARLNYDGGRMRPNTANFTPFSDNLRGQNISFTNLPLDSSSGVHREVISASTIPPAAPGFQTALIGATNVGTHTAATSPDTPAKAPADDTSYSAPSGGVLASLNLQVFPGQAGQALMVMDVDDANPNPPGSKVVIFDGFTIQDINLAESAVFDGFHAEGSACVLPPGVATPPPAGGGGGQPGGGTPGPTDGGGPGGGTPVPGATTPGGGIEPGAGSPDGSSTPSPTPDGDETDGEGTNGGGGDDGDGTPVWPWILVAGVLALVAGGAFAAWRYRSRIPWLRDRFPQN